MRQYIVVYTLTAENNFAFSKRFVFRQTILIGLTPLAKHVPFVPSRHHVFVQKERTNKKHSKRKRERDTKRYGSNKTWHPFRALRTLCKFPRKTHDIIMLCIKQKCYYFTFVPSAWLVFETGPILCLILRATYTHTHTKEEELCNTSQELKL